MPPDRRSVCIRGLAASRTSSTKGVWRSCSVPATRTRAGRTSRPPTSGAPPTRSRRPARAGSVAISTRSLDRSTRWPRGTRRERRRARSSPGRAGVPAIPNATTYTFCEPEPRRGRAAGAGGRADDGGQPGGRPAASGIREQHQPGAIETLDRVAQATAYTPTVAYPNNGFALALRTVAGAIVRGIGSRVYLGADRRLRHARGAGRRRRRRLRQSHGHARRRPLGVLQRHAQPGPGATTRP